MANKNLNKAKEAKKDEFYTQLEDINNELRHYREHFRGKTVLCATKIRIWICSAKIKANKLYI